MIPYAYSHKSFGLAFAMSKPEIVFFKVGVPRRGKDRRFSMGNESRLNVED
jgi:hypothetical protein